MYWMELSDILGNAFINLLDKKNQDTIDVKNLREYGDKVAEILNGQGINATVLIDRNRTNYFFNYEYLEFFEYQELEDKFIVKVKTDSQTLRNHFRAFLTVEIAKAFIESAALEKLGITEKEQALCLNKK